MVSGKYLLEMACTGFWSQDNHCDVLRSYIFGILEVWWSALGRDRRDFADISLEFRLTVK